MAKLNGNLNNILKIVGGLIVIGSTFAAIVLAWSDSNHKAETACAEVDDVKNLMFEKVFPRIRENNEKQDKSITNNSNAIIGVKKDLEYLIKEQAAQQKYNEREFQEIKTLIQNR